MTTYPGSAAAACVLMPVGSVVPGRHATEKPEMAEGVAARQAFGSARIVVLTERPANVREIVSVPLACPRNISDSEILAVRQRISRFLSGRSG